MAAVVGCVACVIFEEDVSIESSYNGFGCHQQLSVAIRARGSMAAKQRDRREESGAELHIEDERCFV